MSLLLWPRGVNKWNNCCVIGQDLKSPGVLDLRLISYIVVQKSIIVLPMKANFYARHVRKNTKKQMSG